MTNDAMINAPMTNGQMTNGQIGFEKRIAEYIATLTHEHLTRSNLVRDDVHDDDPLIWAWTLADRVVLIVNPLRVKNLAALTAPRFTHHLGTVLQGRRIVVTSQRGIFVQVGYYPEPARESLRESLPLDLATQPHPLAVPIGTTHTGALWLTLVELDAVLIGGARRMGKTNLLHTWVAALLQGGETRLILFDGKGGVEFERYANRPRVQVVTDKLAPALAEIATEMMTRFDVLKAARVSNIGEYNKGRGAGARLERIALIVDELAFALDEPGVEGALVDVIARGGAVGIHPILATQRPSSDVVTPRIKSNLVTRIALPVPDRASSMVVLDRAGAESIRKTPGRLLVAHSARISEAQAFVQVESEKEKVKSDAPPLLASPQLSEREARLARAAVEREGWFRVREIADAVGESRDWVNAVAKRWQILGWLTPVQRDASGHQLGRRITPALAARLPPLGSGGQADRADEAD